MNIVEHRTQNTNPSMRKRHTNLSFVTVGMLCIGIYLLLITQDVAASSPERLFERLFSTAKESPLQISATIDLPVRIEPFAGNPQTESARFSAFEIVGDFDLQSAESAGIPALRILRQGSVDAPGQFELSWEPPVTQAELSVGLLVTAAVEARVYSPGANAALRIQESASHSSSVQTTGIRWQRYTVQRPIGTTAKKIELEFVWSDVQADSWVELRDFSIALLPADSARIEQLSPTDTVTPIPTRTPTATPYVVTATPEPRDVFEAATRVVQATEQARTTGTATPLPKNMVTATPTLTPIIVTNTPLPGNNATATGDAQLATAVALTTGEPLPNGAVVLVATAPPTPAPRQPTATTTPTPISIPFDQLNIRTTPTPTITPEFPRPLIGKIAFLSDRRRIISRNRVVTEAYIMNVDGSGVELLTSRHFYNRAKKRDAYSADRQFRAFALREGEFGKKGRIQIFYDFLTFETVNQTTRHGAGVAWAPAWSPTAEKIAYVSSESGGDEIWVVKRDQWPPTRLTHNTWEWDLHPSWSPDGAQIVFMSNRSGKRQLWIMDADGSNQMPLTPYDYEAWDPVWIKYPDS